VELAVQGVWEELDDQAVPAALELVLAAAVRGPVQVAAVPERDRAAAPLKIKLATEPHRRDRAEAPRAADSAAAAETTREPAAAEAAKAWVVAG